MNSQADSLKILIADDHTLVRQSIALFLTESKLQASCTQVACFTSCCAALKSQPPFDLIIVDVFMPPTPGIEALESVVTLSRAAPIIAMSGLVTKEDVELALSIGINGFLSKNVSRDEFISAIELTLAGGQYISPAPGLSLVGAEDIPSLLALTPRQLDVVELISQGLTNKEIARKLEISPATVKIHVASIFRVTGAHNRTELTRLFVESANRKDRSRNFTL